MAAVPQDVLRSSSEHGNGGVECSGCLAPLTAQSLVPDKVRELSVQVNAKSKGKS